MIPYNGLDFNIGPYVKITKEQFSKSCTPNCMNNLVSNTGSVLYFIPPTMGKQLVNFITCGCESSAPFFVIYKAGREPTLYW
jgi:hypothetical protein